jgi:phasin family protein
MKLTELLFEVTADVRDQANAYAERAVEAAREGVTMAATQVEKVESPIDVVAKAGLQLNTMSHEYVERMLEQNVDTLKGALNDGVRRLHLIANAGSFGELYARQVKFNAVSGDRMTRDAKATWEIVTDAGRKVSDLALTTYAQLVRETPVKARRTTRAKKTVKARGKKAA